MNGLIIFLMQLFARVLPQGADWLQPMLVRSDGRLQAGPPQHVGGPVGRWGWLLTCRPSHPWFVRQRPGLAARRAWRGAPLRGGAPDQGNHRAE